MERTDAGVETAADKAWAGFTPGNWTEVIDVRDFIQKNYTPYLGDASFLADRPIRPSGCGTPSRRSICPRNVLAASTTSTPTLPQMLMPSRPVTLAKMMTSSLVCRLIPRSSAP